MTLSLTLATLMAVTGSTAPTQRIPAADIAHAVEQAVALRLKVEGSAAQVRVVGRIDDQALPPGHVRIEPGEIAGRWPRSRIGVPVRLWVDARPVRSMTVWVELRDDRSVLTFAEAYPKHQDTDGLRVVAKTVDMTCCAGETVASADELSALRTQRPVRAGQPLMRSDFEPVPDVLAQQRVGIEVAHGPVRVMTTGVALGDGRIGDRIAVRPDQSREAIASRVVAKQKVMVDE